MNPNPTQSNLLPTYHFHNNPSHQRVTSENIVESMSLFADLSSSKKEFKIIAIGSFAYAGLYAIAACAHLSLGFFTTAAWPISLGVIVGVGAIYLAEFYFDSKIKILKPQVSEKVNEIFTAQNPDLNKIDLILKQMHRIWLGDSLYLDHISNVLKNSKFEVIKLFKDHAPELFWSYRFHLILPNGKTEQAYAHRILEQRFLLGNEMLQNNNSTEKLEIKLFIEQIKIESILKEELKRQETRYSTFIVSTMLACSLFSL